MNTAAPQRLLVCSDLDRTLIPNGEQPESASARQYFRSLVSRPEVRLCYVSGRHLALVDLAIAEYALPRPDYVIGDVGTTIYRAHADHRWTPVDEWHATIAADWSGRSHGDLRLALDDLAELRLQESEKQNRFKLSYYLPIGANIGSLRSRIGERLSRLGVRASQVFSIDEPAGVGLLDILPAGATKLHAVEFLAESLEFGAEDTVFCGDSGNDLEVLASRLPAVLVANAAEDVRRDALEQSARNGFGDRLYIARGGFLGLNGNYAGGAVEGIAHYHPGVVGWLAQGSRAAAT